MVHITRSDSTQPVELTTQLVELSRIGCYEHSYDATHPKLSWVGSALLEKYHSITMVLIPWYFGAVYFTMVLSTMVKYILPWYLVQR